MKSRNPIVANALASNAKNSRVVANSVEEVVQGLDSHKYDSLAWMPKVIGKGSFYPDVMRFPSGFSYTDEDTVRKAWQSGKYGSVIVYKGGSKKGEIRINAKVVANSADHWEQVYRIKGLPVKIVYRGSPYNDLKATVESGNRDYVEIGRFVASTPISQSDAEKLCGPKWSRIKATANSVCSKNAVVEKAMKASNSNTKYKVGDRVKLRGMWGTIIEIGRKSYFIKMSNGEEWAADDSCIQDVKK